jgi:filamentous hemagglutinin
MQGGLAPQRINPNTGALESMELHHTPAQRKGGLFDVQKFWPDEHAAVDPFRKTGN